MRILKTTQTYYPYLSNGGPPAKVRGIAEALARHGHSVTVLTADLGKTNGASSVAGFQRTKCAWGWERKQNGVGTIYLPALMSYRATTINPRAIRFCLKRLVDYEVVHVYGLYDLLGSTVAWFCRRRGIPYVVEPLGMFAPKIRSLRKKQVYRRLIGNTLLQGAATIIVTSETERDELMEGGIESSKIVLRRNGVDLSEYQALPQPGAFRAAQGVSNEEPLILFLGRLSFIKGLDILVQAFAQTAHNARLIVAGPDDNDGCNQAIKELIRQFQLDEQVTITGPVYGADKLQAFVDADFVVLPSRYESFGNVAAESIACGTPVLITNECGIASLVGGRAGLVVPCEIGALRDGMKRLLEDGSLLTKLRSECADVAKNLSWDEPVALMEKVYASIFTQNGVPRHEAQMAGDARL